MVVLLIVSAITAVLLTAGTLLWWKMGDAWADTEHQRFKKNAETTTGPEPRVIHRPSGGEHADR